MEKQHRLRKSADFERVRREGRTWVQELLVLSVAPNELDRSRFGFSVSRWIGKATVRNRAKRLLREAIRKRVNDIAVGWDMVWIARRPMREADYTAVERAVEQLLRRARFLVQTAKREE